MSLRRFVYDDYSERATELKPKAVIGREGRESLRASVANG